MVQPLLPDFGYLGTGKAVQEVLNGTYTSLPVLISLLHNY